MNCDKPALALLTFSPQDAKAWLYDLDQPDPTGGIMLCRRHANATVVPMAWQLVDARDPAWPGPAEIQSAETQSAQIEPLGETSPTATNSEVAAAAVTPTRLPSDAISIDEEFAALRADLPVVAVPYAEPQYATARAAGRTEAAPHDPSLFELPLSDVPAVTPHPGY